MPDTITHNDLFANWAMRTIEPYGDVLGCIYLFPFSGFDRVGREEVDIRFSLVEYRALVFTACPHPKILNADHARGLCEFCQRGYGHPAWWWIYSDTLEPSEFSQKEMEDAQPCEEVPLADFVPSQFVDYVDEATDGFVEIDEANVFEVARKQRDA